MSFPPRAIADGIAALTPFPRLKSRGLIEALKIGALIAAIVVERDGGGVLGEGQPPGLAAVDEVGADEHQLPGPAGE